MVKTCLICGVSTTTMSLCDECGVNYATARMMYDYPPVCLLQDSSGNTRPGQFQTTRALTDYHKNLLHSSNPDKIMLGLKSVMYWGFYSYSPGFALNRVNWLIAGRSGDSTAKSKRIKIFAVQQIMKSRALLTAGKIDLAIQEVSYIGELGQLSFASKVVSSLSPHQAAIYDSRIHDLLGIMNPNQGGVSGVKSQEYQNYCHKLLSIAQELNKGISAEKNHWKWQDLDQTFHTWDVIDVERSLFAISKLEQKPVITLA